ncbi:uncharacterized protein PG998_007246 [Apiospora kogelbergensis]|uniref:Uncharacterized protein n=1 Tax=Apiospora kogelbergensis TaxID=1337665 RepID=A0AAW0QG66_9PEZI
MLQVWESVAISKVEHWSSREVLRKVRMNAEPRITGTHVLVKSSSKACGGGHGYKPRMHMPLTS